MSTSANRNTLLGNLTLQTVVAPVVLSLAGCGNMLPLPPYQYPAATNMPPVVNEPMPFKETADHTFFPSMKNLIAGFVECYEKDYYFIGTDGRIDGNDHWAALAAIVDNLLAHETLEGEDVEDIMRQWLG